MTVFTKPLGICDKPIIINTPYVEGNNGTEAYLDIPEEDYHYNPPPSTKMVNFVSAFILILFLVFISTVVYLKYAYTYHDNTDDNDTYQALCHIPIPVDFSEKNTDDHFHVLPVTWSSKPMLQVVSTMEEPKSDDIMNMLNEELDIGDSVEKIAVVDNGRRVNFIHDFSDNITGIVDEKRCFVMDLQHSNVIPPELLIAGLRSGDQFDLSKVRTHLRAELPAVVNLVKIAQKMAESCVAKPVYRLYLNDVVIEKRSTDNERHDYIQFSGKHVQEIKIDNIAEILKYEETFNKKNN